MINLVQDQSKPAPSQQQFQNALTNLVGQDLTNEFNLLHRSSPQAQVQMFLVFAAWRFHSQLRPCMPLLLDTAEAHKGTHTSASHLLW